MQACAFPSITPRSDATIETQRGSSRECKTEKEKAEHHAWSLSALREAACF